VKDKQLRASAHAAAKKRGHNMGNFAKVRMNAKHPAWSAQCKRCHRHMQVCLNPYPNETEIGGDAVALNCKEPQ
jgi:hypothetical protein